MQLSRPRTLIVYDAAVRTIYVFALGVAALLSGCHSARRSGTCGPIDAAIRVVVHSSLQGASTQDRIITDPEQVRQLVAFANARRDCSQPFDTMPAPRLTATFYGTSSFLGSIGAGPNFFFVSCPNGKGIRTASVSEVGDFSRLTGVVPGR
jgi:hypothetical protein